MSTAKACERAHLRAGGSCIQVRDQAGRLFATASSVAEARAICERRRRWTESWVWTRVFDFGNGGFMWQGRPHVSGQA